MARIATRKDQGLFGPDSVAWRVHGDPAMIVGGMRALLMQALNPRAMAGVVQHSAYREDPWGRFERTAAYVMTATYGTTAQAEAMAARVRRVHLSVVGTDPVSGRRYAASDPDLLAWVHNALASSLIAARRRYGGGLSRPDADRYLTEMVRMAELVGTPADLVPTTEPDLADYLRVAPLVASPAAQRAKWTVLTPPLPAHLRGPWLVADAGTISLLPSRVRRLYGLWWLPPADPAVRAAVAVLALGLRRAAPPPAGPGRETPPASAASPASQASLAS
jgi:uncharacterized protein (DUF2236 family)